MTSLQSRGPEREQDDPGDQEQQPGEAARPRSAPAESSTIAETSDEREPERRHGRLRRSRNACSTIDSLLALVGDDERRGEVDQDSRAAEQREHDEPDAVEHRVHVEVAAEAAADAGDHPVRAAAAQLLVCERLCHGSSVPRAVGRASIRHAPDPTLQSTLMAAGQKLIADNRRARHDYELLDRFEAGIVLTGTEVKSLRDGRATLAQAYADVRDGEVWLNGAEISTYDHGNVARTTSRRARASCCCTAARSTACTASCARRA